MIYILSIIHHVEDRSEFESDILAIQIMTTQCHPCEFVEICLHSIYINITQVKVRGGFNAEAKIVVAQ